ncbi:CBS domain-containing protein [Kutzneria sp. CA-103260]|uniref:CBS domain-containing protein n=1 Tax=Kutzneria sp. CA-103260 TaxID=2802641 RepID=UPI001BA6313E|nr:CBS domain-containing protein [Kutzneria sp. CA-103260]QUQ64045.1 CBS domain-containing protein [Kutzneria sp. CA-103260]
MSYPTVRSVMTTPVIAVTADAPFKEIVRALAEHRVSAVPVVDAAGHVAGVVSEADLIHKEEMRGGLDEVLSSGYGVRSQKAHAGTAERLMSSPVVTIGPDATVEDAASKLSRADVRRLFVVEGDGRLIGVLSRADVLRLFLVPDDVIRGRVLRALPAGVTATVDEGVVTLGGRVPRRSQAVAAIRIAWAMPGVVGVTGAIQHETDDVNLGVA